MAGLSFANEQEADLFKAIIDDKLRLRQQKTAERKRAATNGQATGHQPSVQAVNLRPPGTSSSPYTYDKKKKNNKENKKKEKAKISKADISMPTNFIHVQHIGWDPNTGFDVRTHVRTLSSLVLACVCPARARVFFSDLPRFSERPRRRLPSTLRLPQLDNVSPDLREFFKVAGVGDNDLKVRIRR